MAIFEQKMYGCQCDQCKEIFEHPMSGFAYYHDEGDVEMYATDNDWFEYEGRHYCPKCHKRHDDDDLVTILTDPPITVEC